jgi:hypothetical protein
MKLIKFDLPINGTKVRDLDGLRDNFTMEILELYTSGVLARWLKSRNLAGQAEALLAMADGSDEDKLHGLCGVFEIDADRHVIAAALAKADGKPGTPLAQVPDELTYKERFERLSGLLEDLKRKKMYLSQNDYKRFVKDKIDIECGAETVCVLFNDAVLDMMVPKERPIFSSLGNPRIIRYREQGLSFRFAKAIGDVVEVGEVIGQFYSSGHVMVRPGGGDVDLVSPFRGILVQYADGGGDANHLVYRLDQPVCYIKPDHETHPTIKIVTD